MSNSVYYAIVEMKKNKINFVVVNFVKGQPIVIKSNQVEVKNLLDKDFKVANIDRAAKELKKLLDNFKATINKKIVRVILNLPNFGQKPKLIHSSLEIAKNEPVKLTQEHLKHLKDLNCQRINKNDLHIVKRYTKEWQIDNKTLSLNQNEFISLKGKTLSLTEKVITIPKHVRDSHAKVIQKANIKTFKEQSTSTFGLNSLLSKTYPILVKDRIYTLINWKKDFIEVSIFNNGVLSKGMVLNYGIYDLIGRISSDLSVQINLQTQMFELLNFDQNFDHDIYSFNNITKGSQVKIALTEANVKKQFKTEIINTWTEIKKFISEQNVPHEAAIFNFGIIKEIAGFEKIINQNLVSPFFVVKYENYIKGMKIPTSSISLIGNAIGYFERNINNQVTLKTSLGDLSMNNLSEIKNNTIKEQTNNILTSNLVVSVGMKKKIKQTIVALEEYE